MATQFVQHTVRTGLKGAAIGAVAGMGLSVAYSVVAGPKTRGAEEEDGPDAPPVPENVYQDLEQESDIFYLVQDMGEMRLSAPKPSTTCATRSTAYARSTGSCTPFPKSSSRMGVTSHHHAENARDCMRRSLWCSRTDPPRRLSSRKKSEINLGLPTLHNISMQVQTRIMDSTLGVRRHRLQVRTHHRATAAAAAPTAGKPREPPNAP